jgi:hypothetical protein
VTTDDPTVPARGRAVSVRGPAGTLWRGYHVAASLGRWTLTSIGQGWHCEAAIESRHPVWSVTGPFVLELTAPGLCWRWPIASVEMGLRLSLDLIGKGETAHAPLPVRRP